MKPLLTAIALILVGVGCSSKSPKKIIQFESLHFDSNYHSWVFDTKDTEYITYYGVEKPVGHFGKAWYEDTFNGDHSFYGGTSYCLRDIPQLAKLHTTIDSLIMLVALKEAQKNDLKRIIDSLNYKLHPPTFADGSELDTTALNNAIRKIMAAGGGVVYIPPNHHITPINNIDDGILRESDSIHYPNLKHNKH